MTKIALITGITGQDGSYLAELLLEKGYQVHGVIRRSATSNTSRIDKVIAQYEGTGQLTIHFGDLTDNVSLSRLIFELKPHEIYNLAAQSHVKVSFDIPEYTNQVNYSGTLAILEAIRSFGLIGHTRFYQASTSELYGNSPAPQSETTPFEPCSPYAISKHAAFQIVDIYREGYGMFAVNGILFNHESPRRGELFVSRKVTLAIGAMEAGAEGPLYLGNLNAKRDWGHAKDYVEGMWRMLQQDKPDDYVLATGHTYTVRHFVEKAFEAVGKPIYWKGEGEQEVGIDKLSGKTVVAVDPSLYRPVEVHLLCGDSAKARKELGWTPTTSFEELVEEMVASDVAFYQNNPALKETIHAKDTFALAG